MAQVRIALSTSPVEYPAGTVLGGLRVRMINPQGLPFGSQVIPHPIPAEIVFNNVAIGEHTFEAQQLNSSGIPIGAAFTTPVSVTPPPPVVSTVVVGASVTVI